MKKMTKFAWVILALWSSAAPLWAADDPLALRLIDQARYWQQKNRDDLAAEALRKLLRAEPNHPIALVQLGVVEARAGHLKEAQELYARAAGLTPPAPGLNELDMAIKLGRVPATQLSAARQQAQAGQAQEAVKNYREILGDSKPAGQFGLEYYQTLGATREGWDEARRGLEELVRNNPGDARYLLALARHLTYRETTRREGIRQLAALAQNDAEAGKAWRQALVWLDARRNDRALFVSYLARYPDDQSVTERLRVIDRPVAVYRPDPQDLVRQAGFKLLEKGEVEEAEKRFLSVLAKRPRDVDALGGLGTIRLRQGEFKEAASLLDQSLKSGKRGSTRWRAARDSAQYWALMQAAVDARQAGNLPEAEGKLVQAFKLNGREIAGRVMLADLLTEKREFAKAEPIYLDVLKASPLEPGAFRGLVTLLIQSGRDRDAMAMVSELDEATALKIGGLNQAKATAMLKLAEVDEQQQDYSAAAEKLEDALLVDPFNSWVRLALARQYQKLGDPAGANALLDHLLETSPDMAEALHARALLFAEQQRWLEGLMTLEKIPAAGRSVAVARDQRRFWVNVQVQRAQRFHSQGNTQQANVLMTQAESAAAASQDVLLLGVVAAGWTEMNQTANALRVMREITSRAPRENVTVRIQYAGILLNARQDAELPAVLRELVASDRLTPAQQEEVNKIIMAYTLRQTDALREAGRLAEAYNVVSPALAQSDDPRLLMALARIYNSAGEPAQALTFVESVIARAPDDLEHRLFASAVALGARSFDKAAGHARAALELAPDHPRALAAAGRAEKARGNLAKALQYFQFAQALERDKGAFVGAPGNLALRLVDEMPAFAATSPAAGAGSSRSSLLPVPDPLRKGGRLPTQTVEPASDLVLPLAPAAPAAAPIRRSEARPSVFSIPATTTRAADDVLPQQRSAVPATRLLSPLPALETPQRVAPEYLDPPLPAAPRAVSTRSLEPVRATNSNTGPVAQLAASERSMAEEIGDIKLNFSTTADFGGAFRNLAGEPGLSQLTEIELPLEVRIPLDYDGIVTLRLTPVMLSAGSANMAEPHVAARLGSAALGSFLTTPYTASQPGASGVAISAAYRSKNLAIDVGASPLGFKVSNFVGGISLSDRFDDFDLRGTLSRRAVTDSQLSYAGQSDPRTGEIWGGVVKTGGRFDAGYGDESAGMYLALGYSELTGKGVKSNTELETTVGGYWRLLQSPDTRATIGVNMTALGYRENLGSFTLGNGGYFSPQSYFSFGVPMDIAGRKGKLSYQLGGDVGIRYSRQDRAPYFPSNAGMQASWENQVKLVPTLATYNAFYDAESATGLGYNLYGSFEYLLSPKFALGGRIAFDNSRNFAQQAGMIYLRYAFDTLPQPVQFPPRTLRPLSLGDQI